MHKMQIQEDRKFCWPWIEQRSVPLHTVCQRVQTLRYAARCKNIQKKFIWKLCFHDITVKQFDHHVCFLYKNVSWCQNLNYILGSQLFCCGHTMHSIRFICFSFSLHQLNKIKWVCVFSAVIISEDLEKE